MQVLWHDIQDALFSGRCSAASLLSNKAKRIRFVHQPQLTVWVIVGGWIEEDTSLEEVTVEVGD